MSVARRWLVRSRKEPVLEQRLERELDMPRPLAGVLARRGCRTVAEGAAFLHPSLDQLYDPFELAGMDRAVGRLLGTQRAGEGSLDLVFVPCESESSVGRRLQLRAEDLRILDTGI